MFTDIDIGYSTMSIEERPDLIKESDRGAVIVGAALLDSALENYLRDVFTMHRVSKKNVDAMFDLSGPLSSFSSKSLICYGFRMITKDIFDDLSVIRRLRNRFAHSTADVDFSSEDIASIVKKLKCTKSAQDHFTKTYSSLTEEEIVEWNSSSEGNIKYAKAIFCLGVQCLEIEILECCTNFIREESSFSVYKQGRMRGT